MPVGRTARGKEEEEEEEEVGKLEVPPSAIPAGGGESSQRERDLILGAYLGSSFPPFSTPFKKKDCGGGGGRGMRGMAVAADKVLCSPAFICQGFLPPFLSPEVQEARGLEEEEVEERRRRRSEGGGSIQLPPLPLPPHARKGGRGELLR